VAGSGAQALMASPWAWARWLRPIRCSALRWPITGSTADLRLSSPLICSVTRRFWPEMKTVNLCSGGALWPR
jgi:hypothetical protein